jgi:hypothetical protein
MTLFAELAVELIPAVYYGQSQIIIGVILTHSEPDVQSTIHPPNSIRSELQSVNEYFINRS